MRNLNWAGLTALLAFGLSSVALAAAPQEMLRAPGADALNKKGSFINFVNTPAVRGGDVCGDSEPGVGNCDDGNLSNGDGCSSSCFAETNYTCTAAVSPPVDESVADGSFENGGELTTGAPNPDWAETGTVFTPICNGASCVASGASLAFLDDHWAWFGGATTASTSSVTQTLTIPSNATNLTFNYLVASVGADSDGDGTNDLECGTNADELTLTIDGTQVWSSGAPCAETLGTTPSPGGLPYDGVSIALGAFADDGLHTIVFTGTQTPTFINADDDLYPACLDTNDCALGFTNFFLDNVSIGIPTGDPATPSACTLHYYGQDFDLEASGFILFDNTVLSPDTTGVPAGAEGWGSTDSGNCGVAFWGGGNTTGGTGEALCADSDHLGSLDADGAEPSVMDAYACTPAINLAGTTGNYLTFTYNFQLFGDNTGEDLFEVLVGTATPNLLSIGGYTSVLADTDNVGDFGVGPGVTTTLDVTSLDGEAAAHVCFRYVGQFDWYAEIDDVRIDNNTTGDTDGDGMANAIDNCSLVAQGGPGQPGTCDTNGDGYGNACDGDLTNDGLTVFADLAAFGTAFQTGNVDGDFDCNGFVNFADLATFGVLFGTDPGPSGLNP